MDDEELIGCLGQLLAIALILSIWAAVSGLYLALSGGCILLGGGGSVFVTTAKTFSSYAKSTVEEIKNGSKVIGTAQPAYYGIFFRGGNILGCTFVAVMRQYGRTLAGFARSLSIAASDFASLVGDAVQIFRLDFSEIGSAVLLLWPLLRMGFYVGCIAVYSVVALVLAFVVFAVHGIVLIIMSAGGFVLFSILLLADVVFRLIKQIATHCPNAQCQMKYGLAHYACPSCGELHTKLVPGKYGIVTRKCKCGQKLPTTFFTGRQKLEAHCPFCATKEIEGGMHKSICIPVIGGTSAGKTCYITMALKKIEEIAPKKLKLNFEYVSSDNDAYKTNISYIENKNKPNKTYDNMLNYYRFNLFPDKAKIKSLVAVCDVAGEAYASSKSLASQAGFGNASGYLMVVDPLSIKLYRQELDNSGKPIASYSASIKPLDEVIGTLMSTMQNMLNLSVKDAQKIDLAIVFTKCDIPGLDEQIGGEAVRKYLRKNKKSNYLEAQNALCREFLLTYKENNFLNTVDSGFSNVQFFTCSALGHSENGEVFVSDRVEYPILWLIGRKSKLVNVKEMSGE